MNHFPRASIDQSSQGSVTQPTLRQPPPKRLMPKSAETTWTPPQRLSSFFEYLERVETDAAIQAATRADAATQAAATPSDERRAAASPPPETTLHHMPAPRAPLGAAVGWDSPGAPTAIPANTGGAAASPESDLRGVTDGSPDSDEFVLSRTALEHRPAAVTPPADGTKSSCGGPMARAELAALTVYAGVKTKMGAMKSELQSLRVANSQLLGELRTAEQGIALAVATAADTAEEKLAQGHAQAEASIARHLSFIDQLLADKQELSRQCEALTAQLKATEESCYLLLCFLPPATCYLHLAPVPTDAYRCALRTAL
jgi:hypothetical protein